MNRIRHPRNWNYSSTIGGWNAAIAVIQFEGVISPLRQLVTRFTGRVFGPDTANSGGNLARRSSINDFLSGHVERSDPRVGTRQGLDRNLSSRNLRDGKSNFVV